MRAVTAPDGSFTITDHQTARALSSFDEGERERPAELPTDPELRGLYRSARLAGNLGASMGLDGDQTAALWSESHHFRNYAALLLRIYDRKKAAGAS